MKIQLSTKQHTPNYWSVNNKTFGKVGYFTEKKGYYTLYNAHSQKLCVEPTREAIIKRIPPCMRDFLRKQVNPTVNPDIPEIEDDEVLDLHSLL